MTTQTTTIQRTTKGARAFIGAAATTLAVLGGALLWQARPTSDTVAPAMTATVGTVSDQEMYSRWLQAAPAAAARSGHDVSDQEMYSRWLQAQAEAV